MKKIATLFMRDENDRAHVTREVTPGCEWVLNGEGRPTIKRDGTCVACFPNEECSDDGTPPLNDWWARREVKPGKPRPNGFVEVHFDEVTGKTIGWLPAATSGFAEFLREAINNIAWTDGELDEWNAHDGDEVQTFELCGPKINGNPEQLTEHRLFRHGAETTHCLARDFDGLAQWLSFHTFEGIVWHHPDGRMAKLKRRDFPPNQGASA